MPYSNTPLPGEHVNANDLRHLLAANLALTGEVEVVIARLIAMQPDKRQFTPTDGVAAARVHAELVAAAAGVLQHANHQTKGIRRLLQKKACAMHAPSVG